MSCRLYVDVVQDLPLTLYNQSKEKPISFIQGESPYGRLAVHSQDHILAPPQAWVCFATAETT